MNSLAPCDQEGNYMRPKNEFLNHPVPSTQEISRSQIHFLIIGRSCPWAHRTWLVHNLQNLETNIKLTIAKVNSKGGFWELTPNILECNSLLKLYKKCGLKPSLRATVPTLIDPHYSLNGKPKIISNESSEIIQLLNKWPNKGNYYDFNSEKLKEEVIKWHKLIHNSINNGVYKCGFARNQDAYNRASDELFSALSLIEKSLALKGPWLCGKKISFADIILFPTLIRWECVYEPLFSCSAEPIKSFPRLLKWRKNFFSLPKVADTCDSRTWRKDYFGALFPLKPSNIVPKGPNLSKILDI
tara:strand:+ start:983 stop:1882 length:900 start_codon:yes stop_codon:yes gene_type:complete